MWQWIVPLWNESIVTIAPLKIENLGGIRLESWRIGVQDFLLMTKVLFNINAKALINALVSVLIIKNDLALFCEAWYRELGPIRIILFLDVVCSWKHYIIDFVYLEYADRVPWYFSCNIYFIVNKLGSILVPSLLFDNIRLGIYEFLVLSRPCLCCVVGRW